jgi:hypothetical protein
MLCSNGVAKINSETVRALQKLHPERKSDLILPSTNTPQLTVDPAFVASKLFRESGDQNVSKDVYGWAPWLFFARRGEKKGFFSSLVSFACFIANNSELFPSVCSMLLSGGALTPLHKLGASERKLREETLLPPKLRPINSGSLLAKTILSSVLASAAGKRAAERVAPFQFSLGTSRGVDKLIHVCRAAYESRYIVGKNDFENGFNSLSRQKMLDTHCKLFPESTRVFNFFYGVDSPVFLLDDDMELTVIRSEQGSRQGCSAGTEGFCLAIHPVLVELQVRYPDFDFRAITDDVVPIAPPPVSDSFEDWQALYTRYAQCLNDIKDLSFLFAGLTLNAEKGALLLPAGAPLPTLIVRHMFPAQFEFRQDGMRVAGAPIGTDAFMCDFVNAKVVEACDKLSAIKLVGKKSPRAAHRLLTSCASKLLSFLSSTVPPEISLPFLKIFDVEVENTFFSVISPSDNCCSAERFDRARLKASLPSPHGCGLFKAVDQARIAWWTSVATCMQDALLFKLRSGLSRFAEFAWQSVIALHGGVGSKYWSQVKHLYPDSAIGLLNGTLYSPLHPHIPKINQIALRTVSKIKLETFKKLHAVSLLSDTLTASDIIQASTRSFSGSVFSEPIRQADADFNPARYIHFTRFFLGLPPAITIGGSQMQVEFDYPVQRCLATHGGSSSYLDSAANHASSKCPATFQARQQKHQALERVIVTAAQQAGLTARVEPDTHSLLLGEFSKVDCRRVFPKAASKAYKVAFDAVSKAVDLTSSIHCTLSTEEKQTLIQSKIDLLPLHQGKASGLRIDVSLENTETGELKWIDTSAVHTTCLTYQATELKAVTKRNLSSALAEDHVIADVLVHEPSPTLLSREVFKREKYSRLVMVAAKQHADGKRASLPSFSPFIVSDLGELSPSATDLQEWIVEQYRVKLKKQGRRDDGCSASDLVRKFRHKFKLGIQMAIASGLGAMIHSAGQPWGGLGD